MRQITLVGFLQAQNCTNFAASWRHPRSRTDFLSPDYYQHIGRVLEEGKFHLAFFDDRLGMPEFQGGQYQDAVAHGIRCVKMDPVAVLMAMGMATKNLGLGATCSTTYYEPFHVARQFATVDLMTNGRAAWNVVTSLNNTEARNMGREEVVEHDLRYDQADEFMEVVLGHWDTWEDGAIVVDKKSGLFADPAKVHRLDHVGANYRSRGPFTVPRSAQGHPVVIQAGQSGRGRRFAVRWGELIFAVYPNVELGRKGYAAMKEETANAGRDPQGMQICQLCHPIVAATKAEAEDKRAAIDTLPLEVDSLMLLSEALNFDFGSKPLDEHFTQTEIDSMSGLQTIRDRALEVLGTRTPTVRAFANATGRGKLHDPWVGGPKEIADKFEEWFSAPACDGFVVGAAYVPGAYEDFVQFAVPELQRRGIYRTAYAGTTLRENLGFPRPGFRDWKKRPQ